MLCLMLCFNLSKAENPETILQITAEEKTQDLINDDIRATAKGYEFLANLKLKKASAA